MANHLIIGLGGTGGKVLRELRKRIYEEFRCNDPGNGVFVDYIYVDSSPSDLDDRSGWNVLGKSVHLGAAQKVNINGISTSVLNSISMYPGLKGFMNHNDIQLMQQEMGSLITAGIGGQRRRLGRILIANNIGDKNNPGNFEQAVRGAVGRLQNASGNQDVTFHICAGLAGGTGSGSIIDAVAQIRTWFPYQQDTHAFKMRLFIYTPERALVSVKHDAGFYQANGYAALMELNALSIGKYHPTDVRGETDVLTGDIRRLLENQEAFEAAYLYTNINEQGKVLDLGHGLPAAVADFIFQTTVASGMSNKNDQGEPTGQLSRLVGCENDGADAEKNQAGEKAHSRKFLSFGITRVEFPETEIREYMTYNYALQTVRQMTYNMWQDGIGFGERSMDEVGIGLADEIKNKKNRESLMLSNNYLTLSKPVVESPATKKWRPFEETWENRTQADAGDVMATLDSKLWLSDFSSRCEDYFSNQFRQHGVVSFYKIQQQERKGYAQIIRRHIEGKLFDEWLSGSEKSKSILEIEKYTHLLIDDCSSRMDTFDVQKSKIEEEMNDYMAVINEINRLWPSYTSPLQKIINKHVKAFAEYKTAKCNYYSSATRAIAYGYAKEFLQDIIVELERMLQGIQAFRDELNAINEKALSEASTKCMSDDVQSDTDIKKYDPEAVHNICHIYVSNQQRMTSTAAAIRSRMVANLGEDGERTFANLFDKTDYETAVNIVLEECQATAVRDMKDTAKNDPLNKMVNVNIMEKLKAELNTDEKIEQFVKLVVQTSKSYVQFDPSERNKVIPGNTGAMMQMIQVALPKSDERTNDFRKRLIESFVKEAPGFDPKQDIAENYKDNQIVVISANSGFPLRFLSNVKVAKEKYETLISRQNSKSSLNKMVLHSESFKDDFLPDLYEEEKGPLMQKIVKELIKAYALGLISEQQDPTTQARFDAIRIPDEIFGDTWRPLGKGFVESWNALGDDFKLSQLLKEQVGKEMSLRSRSNDQKAELRKAIGEVVQKRILPSSLCENNQFSPNYTKFCNLAMEIINEELQTL